MQSKGKDKFP